MEGHQGAVAVVPMEVVPAPVQAAQADTDDQLVALWLHGRPANTTRAYRADWERFAGFVDENPVRAVKLGDVQAYADSLDGLAPATRARRLNVVRSLFAFALRIGYLQFNVAAAVKTPTIKDARAERILSEADTLKMINLEQNTRNSAMLRLIYGAGLRVSELTGLLWRDAQARDADDTGQITVFGKGGKTRVIVLSAGSYAEMMALRTDRDGDDDPVFRSRKGGKLDPSQIHRIVGKAAKRAGIKAAVSPHWLRHAHASHALDRGAPISLVQATLGHASVATTGLYLHARPSDSSAKYLAV